MPPSPQPCRSPLSLLEKGLVFPGSQPQLKWRVSVEWTVVYRGEWGPQFTSPPHPTPWVLVIQSIHVVGCYSEPVCCVRPSKVWVDIACYQSFAVNTAITPCHNIKQSTSVRLTCFTQCLIVWLTAATQVSLPECLKKHETELCEVVNSRLSQLRLLRKGVKSNINTSDTKDSGRNF